MVLYLIDIQNPIYRKKNQAHTALNRPNNVTASAAINSTSETTLSSQIINNCYRNHSYEIKLGESNQCLAAYPLNVF
jgi:hypothetical protein